MDSTKPFNSANTCFSINFMILSEIYYSNLTVYRSHERSRRSRSHETSSRRHERHHRSRSRDRHQRTSSHKKSSRRSRDRDSHRSSHHSRRENSYERDLEEEAAAAGIRYIVEPGGSVKDDEVIATCNELGVAMILTGMRHFLH